MSHTCCFVTLHLYIAYLQGRDLRVAHHIWSSVGVWFCFKIIQTICTKLVCVLNLHVRQKIMHAMHCICVWFKVVLLLWFSFFPKSFYIQQFYEPGIVQHITVILTFKDRELGRRWIICPVVSTLIQRRFVAYTLKVESRWTKRRTEWLLYVSEV